MRIVVQRCKRARVTIDSKVCGEIGTGVMLLVGFTQGDTSKEIDYLASKVVNLRIFDDEDGVMNKSLLDVSGGILSISQFTLYGDASKGRRPSYVKALGGDEASKLYDIFNDKLREYEIDVQTGIFGSDMQVELINDGPVTILLEKEGESNA